MGAVFFEAEPKPKGSSNAKKRKLMLSSVNATETIEHECAAVERDGHTAAVTATCVHDAEQLAALRSDIAASQTAVHRDAQVYSAHIHNCAHSL
jgi:hypothetical protein